MLCACFIADFIASGRLRCKLEPNIKLNLHPNATFCLLNEKISFIHSKIYLLSFPGENPFPRNEGGEGNVDVFTTTKDKLVEPPIEPDSALVEPPLPPNKTSMYTTDEQKFLSEVQEELSVLENKSSSSSSNKISPTTTKSTDTTTTPSILVPQESLWLQMLLARQSTTTTQATTTTFKSTVQPVRLGCK